MKTVRRARLLLAGTRSRVYDIELVDLGGTNANRFVVNYRYGWQGGELEEGTRTLDPVAEVDAVRVYESLVVARERQGYRLAGAPDAAPSRPVLVVAAAGARETILAARLRIIDSLPDKKAAALLRRLGELRLKELAPAIGTAARAVMLDPTRLISLRTLPYCIHRTDDGSGSAAVLLGMLANSTDAPTAETSTMLLAVREGSAAPDRASLSRGLAALAAIADLDARATAVAAYFHAAAGAASTGARGQPDCAVAAADLRAIYVQAAHAPEARVILGAVLAEMPMRPPLFKAVRRILQVAEATDDGETLALLWRRFDAERSQLQLGYAARGTPRRAYVGGSLVRIDEEAARSNARLAYTPQTRSYLRRRSWRTLRRLGEAQDEAYVRIAEAVLLGLDDTADAAIARRHKYSHRDRRTLEVRFPPFADSYAANHIMHGRQTRLRVSKATLRWRFAETTGDVRLASDVPHAVLWSARPDSLWRLAQSARADTVVGFAGALLQANPAFIDTLSDGQIAGLIRNWAPFDARLSLGCALAERHLAVTGLTPELAAALMGEASRGGPLVRLYLGARPQMLAEDARLFGAVLASSHIDNLGWLEPLAKAAATRADATLRGEALACALAMVEGGAWPEAQVPRAAALARMLVRVFAADIRSIDPAAIRRLDVLGSQSSQAVAAILAVARDDGSNLVDTGRLAQSPHPELRAAAIGLFAQRSIDAIVADLDAVAGFLTAEAPEPRQAARPIAARLGSERPDAARVLAEKLLPALYRSEQHEGLRDDVLSVLSGELRAAVVALGPETAWTLLRARSEAARRLGATALEGRGEADFSIRQLARIGCNDQVKARTWALAQLLTRIVDLRVTPEDGFALLDSSFDDARNAGYELYRNELRPEDWSPAALVALSDAVTEPAQRFGREMIGRVFEAGNAEYLLTRLAEHPANGFRLLVARLMRDYVGSDVDRLRRLVPTIETTLLQVRKARAAKHQVFAFLEEQLAQPQAAEAVRQRRAIIAAILERIVATCAIEDRARSLGLLMSIKRHSPELALKAAFVPREARR